ATELQRSIERACRVFKLHEGFKTTLSFDRRYVHIAEPVQPINQVTAYLRLSMFLELKNRSHISQITPNRGYGKGWLTGNHQARGCKNDNRGEKSRSRKGSQFYFSTHSLSRTLRGLHL